MTIEMLTDQDLPAAMRQISDSVDAVFADILATPPGASERLYEAMRYAAIGGGKRMRPLLVAASARLFDVAPQNALLAGVAVECVHVHSLVHDDLPCMDDDDLRRGRPTLHKRFDEATAVLAGDALLALAFGLLARSETHADPLVRAELISTLASSAGASGMASGQMMDMAAVDATLDMDAVVQLQQLKTGAMIGWCVGAGAALGAADADQRAALTHYAQCVSVAFQIADDLLDVEGDEQTVGKRLRKDDDQGKQTLVRMLGRESARNYASGLVDRAVSSLSSFGPAADLLRSIAHFSINRDR